MPNDERGGSGATGIPLNRFDPGPPWLPYAVSLFHLFLLVISGLLFAAGNDFFSSSLIRGLNIPVSEIAFQSFCIGVIGGTLCASRWVILSVGRNIYDRNRVLWQLLIPVHGGFLAVFVLIAVNAGLMSMVGSNEAGQESNGERFQWFILTLAFLSGFASKVLIERIEGMARALFGKEPEERSVIKRPADENSEKGPEAGE